VKSSLWKIKFVLVMECAINRKNVICCFKLNVLKHAKDYGNRGSERHFDPPQKKIIREWRRPEKNYRSYRKISTFFIHFKMA
jgi:hypothetical protein